VAPLLLAGVVELAGVADAAFCVAAGVAELVAAGDPLSGVDAEQAASVTERTVAATPRSARRDVMATS